MAAKRTRREVVRGRFGRECWSVFGEEDGMALALACQKEL